MTWPAVSIASGLYSQAVSRAALAVSCVTIDSPRRRIRPLRAGLVQLTGVIGPPD